VRQKDLDTMNLELRKRTPLILAAAAALLAGSGQAASSGRFRPDGTVVYDANTGLSWEQYPLTTAMTLSEANARCLALGASFRLPNMKELQTVVDRSRITPAVDNSVFETVQPSTYWTSSTLAEQAMNSWFVEFGMGVSTFGPSTGSHLTWCVRSPAQAAR
jgi:hypothetical protein